MRFAVTLFLFAAPILVARAQGDSPVRKAGRALERAAQARADKKMVEKYDPVFKKYSKRYFGPAFDWKYFKAQGFAESGLNANARAG